MKTSAIVEGLIILQKYRNKNGQHISARRDAIVAHFTDSLVSKQDVARLYQLKWFQGRHGDIYDRINVYDPSENWACFV